LLNFIREVQPRITQVSKDTKHNLEDILSAELAGLRDLKKHKILNEEEYNQAKQCLMKTHATLDQQTIK